MENEVKGAEIYIIWEFVPPQFWDFFPRFFGCSSSSSSSGRRRPRRRRLLEIGKKAPKNTHFWAPRGTPLKTAIKL